MIEHCGESFLHHIDAHHEIDLIIFTTHWRSSVTPQLPRHKCMFHGEETRLNCVILDERHVMQKDSLKMTSCCIPPPLVSMIITVIHLSVSLKPPRMKSRESASLLDNTRYRPSSSLNLLSRINNVPGRSLFLLWTTSPSPADTTFLAGLSLCPELDLATVRSKELRQSSSRWKLESPPLFDRHDEVVAVPLT